MGRLQAHRWHHVAVVAKTTKYESLGTYSALFLSGRSEVGSGWANGLGMNTNAIVMSHADGTPNHMRFGEIAAANNMNYVADATFANVQTGGLVMKDVGSSPVLDGYKAQFATVAGGGTPAAAGRYFKETGSAYRSALLPAGARPLRVTWTEIPADLWFDGVSPDAADGWLGDPATGYLPGNDRFGPGGTPGGDGLRDVRVKIEVWDAPPVGADVLLGTFQRAGDPNRIPVPKGRLYYKAVFVNDWSANIRLNYPLDETPFLDDVTVAYAAPAGSRGRFLSWEEE
ncbi:MAG: hypothetical protein HY608_02160 [Planctomycetes bacterium]|nr:hypothetical protein [Planctomycetota bacterium]